MHAGARLLVKTVRAIENNSYKEVSQNEISDVSELKHAPKIYKEDCEIHWNRKAQAVHNLIRGLSPYPTAFCSFQEKTLKIYNSKIELAEPQILPGKFLSDGRTYLKFACTDGFILVTDVQMEGKKRMLIEEFLRGTRIT
jgi:methionyl-tRNA formyltransferase